jgi:hypothetical protein
MFSYEYNQFPQVFHVIAREMIERQQDIGVDEEANR